MAREDPAYNIKFVRVIEKHPCIYDYTLTAYSKKEATHNAWLKVAEEMKDTVNNCKERWRNLRTVFVRKVKPTSSRMTGKKSGKPYYLMDVMQFLLPFVKFHQPIDAAVSLSSHGQTFEEETKEGDVEETEEEVKVEDDEEEEGNSDQETRVQLTANVAAQANAAASCTPRGNSVQTSLGRKKRESRNLLNDSDQTLTDLVTLKKARMNLEDDPRRQFLLSLLPDVHAMTDAQMRRFRRLVLDAVDTVLDGSAFS